MRDMIQKKRDRLINHKQIPQEETQKIEENKKISNNLLEVESSDESKSSKSDDKDFQFYGDEDLYYKEEKLNKDEIENIKDNIRNLRIKLVKFFISEVERVNDIIKRLKPQPQLQKKSLNVRKSKQEDKMDENNTSQIKETKAKEEEFKELLDLISQLTELSHFDVYYDNYNKIVRDYGEKSLIRWKYRVVQGEIGTSNEYGDFSTEQIREWFKNVFSNFNNIQYFY